MNQETIVIVSSLGAGLLLLVIIITFCCTIRRQRLTNRRIAAQMQPQQQPQQHQPTRDNPTFTVRGDDEAAYGFGPDLNLEYGAICQICQDNMDGNLTIGRLHPCNHSFHKNCIYQWFVTQYNESNVYNCPVCRESCPPSMICTKIIPLSRNR